MDWLRRNWPDMLIGLALVAVIAGIVATLLTGGSFFPLGSGGTTMDAGLGADSPPSVSVPRAETGAPDDGGGLAGTPSGSNGGLDAPDVALGPRSGGEGGLADGGLAEGGLADPAAGPPGAPDPVVTGPSSGGAQPLAPGDDTPSGASGAASSGAPTSASPAGAAGGPAAGVSAPERAAEDAPVLPSPEAPTQASNASLPSEPFRVSVGAFGDAANAERQAERFRSAGYPVFIGRQGQFHIVLVGPYSQEDEARRVAGEISEGDFGIEPVIYRFQPDGTTRAGTVSASGAPFASVEDAQADASAEATDSAGASSEGAAEGAEGASQGSSEASADAPAAAPIASNGGRLLQVGAYADVESAEPQVQRLESLGLTARRLQENGMVKLVVGPFSGEALEDARTVLTGAGIDFFAR